MKTFLLISPEKWTDHHVSKHHYAKELVFRGYTVLFLEPESSHKTRFRKIDCIGPGQLIICNTPKIVRGLRFLPKFIRRYVWSTYIAEIESVVGVSTDIIWLFENSRFYDLDFFSGVTIYHQVDLNQNFHVVEAASTADYIFASSNVIKSRLETFRDDVTVVNHGVNPSFNNKFMPTDYSNSICNDKFRFHCTYAGNLSIPYIDVEAISKICRKYDFVLFNFYGSYGHDDLLYRNINMLENVTFHGKVDSVCLLNIYRQSDVLLLAYDLTYVDQVSNPHKVMEYLYSGTAIAATYTDQYVGSDDILPMCRKDQDFSDYFGLVLDRLGYLNSDSEVKKRIEYAEDNTYEKQVKRILDIVFADG